MRTTLDLRKGVCETSQYKAWRFPAGELHVKLTMPQSKEEVVMLTNMATSDDIVLLMLTADLLRKHYPNVRLILHVSYMAYQQADRDF